MASEIERKFLLQRPPPELEQNPAADIEQGYLVVEPDAEVRVRRRGETFSLTLKRGAGEEREEVEVELGRRQFQALWEATADRRVAKRRYLVALGAGVSAEVDVYFGSLAGLRVAEVEFPSREAARSFQPPDWFGREITGDHGYANQTLAVSGIPSVVSGGKGRAYRLKEGESRAEGTKRIALGRAEKALERLHGVVSGEADKADAVHGARKDMKKLRTLLRLLRESLPRDLRKEEKERYRDAGRMLSASRDAEVKLETLERLADQAEELPEAAVESWRQFLEGDRQLALNTDEGALTEAAALIEAGQASIEEWRLEGDGWGAIDGALERVYRRGRRAMHAAGRDPSEDNFHQWRKRAKDLRYVLELLEGAWKAPLAATAEEADRLGDLLGEHQDLAVLREDLRERRLGEEETRRLEAAIAARLGQLAAAGLDLGGRLYAERPKEFSRRLRRYWESWRG